MQFGLSSYSFHARLSTGELTIFDVIDWIADSPAEHLEFASIYRDADSPVPNLASTPQFVEQVREHAANKQVRLSNLAVGADFVAAAARGELDAEIAKVKQWVDLAERLGISLMRHDVARGSGGTGDDTVEFDQALPTIVAASKEIAQYAASKEITTSLENHGYFVQASERVRRVVHGVNEANFKTTLDVGNFVCVDEDPAVAVALNLPLAMIVHFKDFYIRDASRDLGEGWFRSRGGKNLRGAVVGTGDLDLAAIAQTIAAAGYDGFISIEFEGWEDCLVGSSRGLDNAIRLMAEANAAHQLKTTDRKNAK